MDRILVVDDMKSNVELMVIYLREAGYDVITANDGETGIKKAKIFEPDLIVLDLIMPKISGFDVCKTLKRDSETKNIMILAVTAMPSKDSRIRAFESGVDDYMEKNFDKGTFIAKIKSLLRIKSLNDALKENYAVLEEQSRQFEIQLEMARHVQQSLIAEMNFSFNNVQIASCYRPAQSVGGDLYDVVTFGVSSIAMFIADVSGHGVSAALLTSMLKLMFRNLVETYKEADKLLYQMNEEFCRIFAGASVTIYASAFFALFDMEKSLLSYSNAGGAQPLFLDRSAGSVTELQLSGKPLGIMPGSVYTSKSAGFDKGDMFFFHTDGLGDSFYKNEPDVFVKKLSVLLLNSVDSSPEEIIEDALGEFYNADADIKSENDDVSIIVCKME